jgi:hypothetical protein
VPAAADEFVPLLKGRDGGDFELVGIVPETLAFANDGEVRISGKPKGYFATRANYTDYDLRFEWMYERPDDLLDDARFRGNGGVLLHIQPPHKVWPRCVEVQLMNADAGDILPLVGATCRTARDPAAQKRAVKPVGQWNQAEIGCHEGAIVCRINGIEVARGTECDPKGGAIGWQSEGTPIRLRKIRIKTRP